LLQKETEDSSVSFLFVFMFLSHEDDMMIQGSKGQKAKNNKE
jgi:hypothetical protein